MFLVLEAIDKGQIKLTDTVSASPDACKMGGSQIWLEPGEQMTVSDLMKAICIVSANDASFAVSEHLAGSEENFVALMNKRCKELGMKETHFVNTTGLNPDQSGEGNLTSAYDMAVLASELLKHPDVLRWTGTWLDNIRGGKSYLRNTNYLVRFYSGCDGLKTGFTEQAGFCLVGTAQRDGVRMIAVVMNADTSKIRSREVGKLFNYGFSLFKSETIYPAGAQFGKVRVILGKKHSVNAVLPKGISIVMRRDVTSKPKPEIILKPSLKAPVNVGTPIGFVRVTIDGKEIARADLMPEHPVESLGFFSSWVKLTRDFFGKLFTNSI
jgi:D-alanyl-D-alanine carboxypeptidase (penicillin-binding protein 5/6)